MRHRPAAFVSVVILTAAGLLLGPAAASAQNVGIAGRVTDTTGGVLPGVTVEASSPALIEQARTVGRAEQRDGRQHAQRLLHRRLAAGRRPG